MLIYVKIVGKDRSNEIRNRVFATNFLSYKKRFANNIEEFIIESKGNCLSDCLLPENKSFDYLELNYIDSDTKIERTLIVPDSSVYLLNVNGKTIDSIHCGGN